MIQGQKLEDVFLKVIYQLLKTLIWNISLFRKVGSQSFHKMGKVINRKMLCSYLRGLSSTPTAVLASAAFSRGTQHAYIKIQQKETNLTIHQIKIRSEMTMQ